MCSLPTGLVRNEAKRTGLLVPSHAGSHGGPAWSVWEKARWARRRFFKDIEIAGSFTAGAQGETMSSIHSAAGPVVRLCLRRARKRPVRSRSLGRTAPRVAAVLAVAVMIGGATAAQAAASTGPSVILNGNDTDIAVQGPNDSLTFYYAADGSSTWEADTVAGPGTTYSAPAMILDGSTVDIAAEGPDGSLDFYSATTGTSTWHSEVVAGEYNIGSAPAIILDGSTVDIAAESQENNLWFFSAASGTSSWNHELINNQGTTFSAPSMILSGGDVDVAIEGLDNSLVSYRVPIGGDQWTPVNIAGPGTTFSAPAMIQNGSGVDFAAQSVNNALMLYWSANGTTTSSSEIVDGDVAFSAPSMILNSGGVDIAVQGQDNALGIYWQAEGSGNWDVGNVAALASRDSACLQLAGLRVRDEAQLDNPARCSGRLAHNSLVLRFTTRDNWAVKATLAGAGKGTRRERWNTALKN